MKIYINLNNEGTCLFHNPKSSSLIWYVICIIGTISDPKETFPPYLLNVKFISISKI